MTPVSAPNYQTQLTGISSNGTVVGAFNVPVSEDRYGFKIVAGKIQQLPLLEEEGVLPFGVNSSGTIVVFGPGDAGFLLSADGSYQDPISRRRRRFDSMPSGVGGQGFTYFQGTFNDVVYPGSLGTAPSGISNTGVIIGTWEITNQVSHCFTATPVQ